MTFHNKHLFIALLPILFSSSQRHRKAIPLRMTYRWTRRINYHLLSQIIWTVSLQDTRSNELWDSLAAIARTLEGSGGVDIDQEGTRDHLTLKINLEHEAR